MVWLASALAFLCCLPCWSDSLSAKDGESVVLTAEEWTALLTFEERLKAANEQQSRLIRDLETSLSESRRGERTALIKVGVVSFSVGLSIGAAGILIAALR